MTRKPFQDLSDEDKKNWMMSEYQELSKVNDDDIDFSGKTSMWVAYERHVESCRDDALFCDTLAKYFAEPYGERLSTAMMIGMKPIFDPKDEIGFGWDGHVLYSAARTKFINDHVLQWLESPRIAAATKKQVLNLGAGADTRAFWFAPLQNTDLYLEVDTAPVLSYKQKVLDSIEVKGNLPPTFCKRETVALDFSKESIQDLPEKGFETDVPTCWILEGLVMYLKPDDVDQLLDELSNLSPKDSCAIINFSVASPASHPDKLDKRMEQNGWTKKTRVFFGEESFNYGRYPEGKPANAQLGFCVYTK